ncbi:MAG: hypothetical protein NE330_01660 [Lentisphaeraceae bacterium]|nr:hypothetical protein [Lentisphaeraceae bacterium]
MFRLFLFINLLLLGSSFAEMSIKNEEDRAIFKDVKILASQLLSKSPKDKKGGVLLKFAGWLKATDADVKKLKTNLIFQDQITPLVGDVKVEDISSKLIHRLGTLKEQVSSRLLYIVIAHKINPDAKTKALYDENSNLDMTLSKLLNDAPKPEIADLEKLAEEEALRLAKMKEENSIISSAEKPDIEKILDAVHLDSFAYSEASAVHAINTLTHNLFWRGCQVRIHGKRFHYIGTQKSTVGALFYTPPFPLPVNETYKLKKMSIRKILDHMASSLKVLWEVQGNDIVFIDASPTLPVAEEKGGIVATEDGIAADELENVLSEMRVSDLKKYRGKYLEVNGQITGFGRGMGNKEYFIALDGGAIRVYFDSTNSDMKIFNRLRLRCDDWRKNGGLQKMRDKKRDLEKKFEDIDRATLADPKLFLNFKALCASVNIGKLVFKDPEFAFIKKTGEYIVKKELKKKK